jgi:two-component system cell cycle sensor histidine kinase/response regulator CckA
LSIHRPFQIPVLVLLALSGYLLWKRRAEDPVFEMLTYSFIFLFISDLIMLFSSFSIAMNHDGTIRVDSKVGLGTTFYLYLPAISDSRPEEEKEKDGIMYGTGKILVMDDEEIVRNMIGPMLRVLGYDVEFATRGEEAFDMYKLAKEKNIPFKAVILDLTIPGGKGGKQTVEELLAYDPNVRAIV